MGETRAPSSRSSRRGYARSSAGGASSTGAGPRADSAAAMPPAAAASGLLRPAMAKNSSRRTPRAYFRAPPARRAIPTHNASKKTNPVGLPTSPRSVQWDHRLAHDPDEADGRRLAWRGRRGGGAPPRRLGAGAERGAGADTSPGRTQKEFHQHVREKKKNQQEERPSRASPRAESYALDNNGHPRTNRAQVSREARLLETRSRCHP